MFPSKPVSVDRSFRRTAGVLTDAWRGAHVVANMLLRRGHERVDESGVRDLRLGSLLQPPVMLVHGLGADKSSFGTMAEHLHRAGYTVYSVSYSRLGSDIESCAKSLERDTAWLLKETGSECVNVIAHSLGGVILRWAAAHTRMREWLSLGITLGSPHRGTPTARLAPSGLPGFGKIVSQLRPGGFTIDSMPTPSPRQGGLPRVRGRPLGAPRQSGL
ncbi:MAG: esterase/lipase family protein [Marmoricola sp.]